MASSSAAAPPLSDLSGVAEELRRQLAAASDAHVASEVGHQHQTVLSNIMIMGEKSGQIAPEENLERGSPGVAKATAVSPVSNFKNGTDHNTSPEAQAAPPASALDQISTGSDFISHHNQTPFDPQSLTPDVNLAQAAHLEAAPPSQAEQSSRGESQTTYIDVNDAPVAVVQIADQTTDEDAGFSFAVPGTSFIDVDVGDTLTLSATLADGSPLPAWLTFDPVTQTFSGTPLNDDVGALTIRVTATDTSGATATQDFQVTVNNTNDGPVASVQIADQSIDEDAGFSFTVAPTSFTDVDVGDTLTLSATLGDGSPLPAWLSFNPATQTFSGTPLNDDVGALTIRVTATDTAGATATQDFQVTVNNTNDGPVASAQIADQSTDEDAGFSFAVPPASFTDVDVGDSLTLSATLADGSPLPAWLSFNPATQTFSGTPLNDDVGSLTIRVTATDTSGASATQDFQVTVNNTNDGPVASVQIADQSTDEDAGFSFAVPPASFTDVDVGDTLTLSATLADGSALPAWLSFNPATQTFSGTPLNDDVGALTIRVTATDTSGATATQDFSVTVNNTNDAPVITSSNAAGFAENATGTVYTATATDVDAGTTLTYSISGADAALFDINTTTGAITFKSSPNYEAPTDAGSNNVYDVTIGASDGTVTTTKDVAITVTNVNEAPTITSGSAVSFAENKTGTVYTVAATDPDAGATLTYSLTGTDAARFNINATTGAISFKSTPNYEAPADAGANNVYDVTVRASDGTNITTKAVAITVTNVNEAPVITSAATASFAENATGTVYTATATDVDAGTTLTYSLTGTDAARFNIDATTGAVTFKSSPNYEAPTDSGANNVYNVTVRASDGALTTSKAVAITVTNVGNEAPVFTSGGTANFAENAAGTVYTAAATPDAGKTLTYSLTGTDATLFNINATTGVVTFKSSPNYEAPTDAGGNNVYDVSVTASDGTNSATKDVAISVTNVNEAPTITSGAATSFAENATGTVYTVAATDQDAGATLTYSLTGTDAARFNINATTGAITFKSSPNYEAPTDVGANNVYDVTVRASDGVNITTKAVAITVTNVNEAPTVTSAATKSFAENATGTVYTATATDPDAGTTLTYSISGADASLFDINAATGAVTFKSSPNYEVRADAGANNVYDITVGASDGTNTTTKAVAITVTNVNEAPTITSGSAVSFAENKTGTVYTVAATDPDAGATLTYSLTGTDAARFNINSTTGAITFKSTPNYEAPTDAGANNVYDVTVRASDGTNITTKAVAITVTNVNEAPTVTSAATASFAENGTGTVYTVAATDPDAGTTLSYSLTGADASLFNINAATGVVTFKSAPNYEAPTDAGGNNVYNITVGASDGAITTTKAVAVTVTNVTNEAPVFTSGGSASFAENAAGTVYTAAAIPEAGKTLTYSLTGTDATLFNINATTGAVTFKSSPNYEAPTDAGGNNVYDVTVNASDGTKITTQAVAITVTNVNEAPTVTSAATASVGENATGTVYTAAAADPDAGTTLTYSISGADAALFDINATTGAMTFKSSPDYEAPTDVGGNNVYDVTVSASDGTITTTKAVGITVTNVNEAPTVTSAETASFAENAAGTVYSAAATDPDAGTTLTYSISGADASLFDINATTGAVTFKSSPDYEAPTDAGGNNVYDVTVGASDGTNTTTKDVAITVTNVNEAPTVTSAATASFAENAAGTVYTAAAADPDAGTSLTYSISGADATLFNIDSTTGAVTFKSAPNYEAPTDAGADNIYDVKVTASDGTVTASQDVAITVSNVNEAPTLTTAPSAPGVSGAPQSEIVLHVSGDQYLGSPVMRVSVDGTVVGTYTITADHATGAWQDIAIAGDFGSTGPSNVKVEFTNDAYNGTGFDRNLVVDKITVNDVTFQAEDAGYHANSTVYTGYETMLWQGYLDFQTTGAAPGTGYNVAENSGGTIILATGNDPDAGTTLTYSISGTDAALFDIDANTGAISFKSSPNYEAPADAGGNNVYHVTVSTSDGTNTASENVTVKVTNVNEAPTVTSAATASFAENAAGTVYTAAATDPDAGTTLTYSISGADASLFNINAATGAVTFKSSPNYEAPGDTGADNVYDVTVSVSDGVLATSKAVAFTVTNANEAPTGITVTGSLSVQETVVSGGTIGTAYDPGTVQPVIATLSATDPDAGDTMTYSLVGAPAGLFTVSGNQILVAAGASFDYETTPSYTLTVRATDSAGNTVDQPVNVTISNYASSYAGTAGNDTATGTSEEDTMAGGGGSDTLYGGDGNDTLTASSGGSTLDAGNGNDIVYGGNGNDIISGGAGNDTVYASGGIDKIDGGSGSDTIIYSIGSADMTIDLSKGLGYYTSHPAGADSFSNFENASGGSANDSLIGNSLDNILSGGAGNDIFIGGAGNDTMLGGDGADLFFLQAGLGNDTVAGGVGGSWIDAIDLHDASGSSYSGAFPGDWTLILTSGSVTSTGVESLTLSTDSAGYVQHSDGTQVNFTEIEQIRW